MEQVALAKLLQAVPAPREEAKERARKVFRSTLSAREKKVICVTGGNSSLGSSIARELLARGYLVRLTLQHQGELDDLKEVMKEEELSLVESVVVAKMGDPRSLCDAFRGCHAVFHTSSCIDPHGISGYTEQMAFLETVAARNVIEACAEAAYIKRCVFTSSLLASIWQNEGTATERRIDESCWSDIEFCRTNKLWLALGKTKAESIAWRKSKELKVKLVTVCPGLLMAPAFPNAHKETSVPYLKGGQRMLHKGLLAIGEMKKVAEAHVQVYEAMDYGASGRYHCFQRVVRSVNEAVELENELKMQGLFSGTRLSEDAEEEICSRLSNSKLKRLLSQRQCSCCEE